MAPHPDVDAGRAARRRQSRPGGSGCLRPAAHRRRAHAANRHWRARQCRADLFAIHNWTFLLVPSFVVGVGNGMMLGDLMYRSGLVPRPLALLGLIGGPLVCASGTAVLFGLLAQGG